MFDDPFEREIRKAEEVLKDYELEELLDENELTPAEAFYWLVHFGICKFPETLPTTVDAEFGEGDDE